MLHSPYRELVRPIVEYATEIRRANPRGVVAVYIPEYVVGRWWEQLLHNQTALRLKGRLLFTPGVMVTSVPYQLRSSQIARERELRDDVPRPPRRPAPRRGRTSAASGATCTVNRADGPVTRRRPRRGARPAVASRVGERFEVEVGPVAHGGHCVARLGRRRAGWSSSGTPSRASGSCVEITEGTEGDRFWRATPSRCWSPRRTGSRRRARTPARAAAAAATSSTSPWPGSGR